MTVNDVKVSIGGQAQKDYQSVSTIEYVPDNFKIEENKDYEFDFVFGGMTKKVTLRWSVSPQFYENPLFIFLAVLSAVVFGVGFYLKRPDVEMFGLDIPDFPPTSTMKVSVKKDSVLSIFEQVNRDYAWERMPLKLEEIKNGFRKISYGGRPVVIGDYNLERILDSLIAKGLVKEESGYYGLTQWEDGKTIGNLAVLRQMRDVFVTNVVRFSKFGERSDCDSLINVGQEVYVHVYDGERTVERALRTCSRGLTIIVFKSEDQYSPISRGC